MKSFNLPPLEELKEVNENSKKMSSGYKKSWMNRVRQRKYVKVIKGEAVEYVAISRKIDITRKDEKFYYLYTNNSIKYEVREWIEEENGSPLKIRVMKKIKDWGSEKRKKRIRKRLYSDSKDIYNAIEKKPTEQLRREKSYHRVMNKPRDFKRFYSYIKSCYPFLNLSYREFGIVIRGMSYYILRDLIEYKEVSIFDLFDIGLGLFKSKIIVDKDGVERIVKAFFKPYVSLKPSFKEMLGVAAKKYCENLPEWEKHFLKEVNDETFEGKKKEGENKDGTQKKDRDFRIKSKEEKRKKIRR